MEQRRRGRTSVDRDRGSLRLKKDERGARSSGKAAWEAAEAAVGRGGQGSVHPARSRKPTMEPQSGATCRARALVRRRRENTTGAKLGEDAGRGRREARSWHPHRMTRCGNHSQSHAASGHAASETAGARCTCSVKGGA